MRRSLAASMRFLNSSTLFVIVIFRYGDEGERTMCVCKYIYIYIYIKIDTLNGRNFCSEISR